MLDRRYEVGERIARGGMATVYEGVDLRLERRVAIKVMHPHLGDDPDFRERFHQEAKAAARLAHPNVVNIYDHGEESGLAWLVMELVPSITLRDLLAERTRITADQALDVLEAILAGLAAAHRAGIVHRDLKPENILLAHDGRIKIGDFGLARAATANTATGKALLGTIAYLSPELVTRGIADTRSDMYAIGILLFEMVTGRQPFTGDEPMQIAFQHANEQVPLPSSLHPGVPESIDALVHWATQREPNLRPANAAEMLDEVQAVRERGLDAPTSIAPVVAEDDRETSIIPKPSKRDLARLGREPQVVRDSGDGAATALLARRATVRRRRGMLWLAVVLLGALLAAGVGWWFNAGPGGSVTVPEVAGALQADAVAHLESQRIVVAGVDQEPSYDIPAGAALRTDPPAGTVVGNGGEVRLVVSTGRRSLPVPTVAGGGVDEARAAIEAAEFTVAEGEPDAVFDEAPAGTVLAGLTADGTDIATLETLEERAPIALRVSLGPVPAAAGQAATDARAALEQAGLEVDFSAEQHSSDVPAGSLISLTLPEEGPVRPGQTVTGVVSLGPVMVDVPDVRDQSIPAALQLLRDRGFQVDLRTNVPEALWPAAVVRGQTPTGGKLEEGSTVVLEANY